MTSIQAIRDAVHTMLYWMDGANVVTWIPPDHIYPSMAQAVATSQDKDYPKAMVTVSDGTITKEPSRMQLETVSFDIILVFKNKTGRIVAGSYIPLDVQVLQAIDDLKEAVSRNDTLGGIVEAIVMEDWTTDSGFSYPEGIVWAKVKVEYRGRR